MSITDLLSIVVQKSASDLHIVNEYPLMIRINGELVPLPQFKTLDAASCKQIVNTLMTDAQRKELEETRELDFSYTIDYQGERSRFRVNAYYQRSCIAASLRHIPNKFRTFEELSLPSSLAELHKLKQGFILVTGPTGHGKSTTLATVINEINKTRKCHIVTIEDPIEYVFPVGRALVSQREVRVDTYSWHNALRAILREDPDVVLVGEMRDQETIASALTIAETGHLVFSTLHTNSAAQTIDRIIDVFPEHKHNQVRLQLASSLSAVICQRLTPALGGGRIPALEILISTNAVKTSIRDGKTHMIDNIIQTSKEVGMISLEEYYAMLVNTGKVEYEVAMQYVLRPNELRRYLKK